MIAFIISSGELWIDSVKYAAYSGYAEYMNKPECCAIAHLGPIPKGTYTISPPYSHPRLGPIVFKLTPTVFTDTFGRSQFRIHGDNGTGNASHGCIVAGLIARRAIASSNDRTLKVLA